MNRAEPAGIAAALINKHTHIATDRAGALRQMRNSIHYLQRMKWHRHAKLQENIVHHIQLSKDTIHLYKVKAHAGILGNECADAVAKCCEKLMAMISILTPTTLPSLPTRYS